MKGSPVRPGLRDISIHGFMFLAKVGDIWAGLYLSLERELCRWQTEASVPLGEDNSCACLSSRSQASAFICDTVTLWQTDKYILSQRKNPSLEFISSYGTQRPPSMMASWVHTFEETICLPSGKSIWEAAVTFLSNVPLKDANIWGHGLSGFWY